MTDPSKERIAAALRLAEANYEWANIQEPPEGANRVRCWVERVQPALSAYRATLPRIRSRAEVDAEIGALWREFIAERHSVDWIGFRRMQVLGAEPTADSGPSEYEP